MNCLVFHQVNYIEIHQLEYESVACLCNNDEDGQLNKILITLQSNKLLVKNIITLQWTNPYKVIKRVINLLLAVLKIGMMEAPKNKLFLINLLCMYGSISLKWLKFF